MFDDVFDTCQKLLKREKTFRILSTTIKNAILKRKSTHIHINIKTDA